MKKNKEVKKVKKKICEGAVTGYWKGEPVALIPKYRPDVEPDDYNIEEIEVSENHPSPEILDPNTTPLSVVKEICTITGMPFSWITGITLKTMAIALVSSGLFKVKVLSPCTTAQKVEVNPDFSAKQFAPLAEGGLIKKIFTLQLFKQLPSCVPVDCGCVPNKIKAIAKSITPMIENTPLSEAIEYFLVFGTNGTTLSQYRRIFRDLAKAGVITCNMLIIDYLQNHEKIEANALNFSNLGNTGKKNRYNYNDKIYNILKSFHLFLRNPNHFALKYGKRTTTTDSCTEETNTNPSKSGKTKPKIKKVQFYRPNRDDRMTDEEAALFFPALKSINSTHAFIAEILRWFNHEICNDPDAPCIHLESVLQMQPFDIGPDSLADIRAELPEDVGGNSVSVRSKTFHASKVVCYYVRGSMYAKLVELAKNTDLFLFQNKFGGPIDPGQVRRSFAKACKKANLRSITPSQLR